MWMILWLNGFFPSEVKWHCKRVLNSFFYATVTQNTMVSQCSAKTIAWIGHADIEAEYLWQISSDYGASQYSLSSLPRQHFKRHKSLIYSFVYFNIISSLWIGWVQCVCMSCADSERAWCSKLLPRNHLGSLWDTVRSAPNFRLDSTARVRYWDTEAHQCDGGAGVKRLQHLHISVN